jgi:hypothetical protein
MQQGQGQQQMQQQGGQQEQAPGAGKAPWEQ